MALLDMIAHKKIAVSKRVHILDDLKKIVRPTVKKLSSSLKGNCGFICEIKFASPSKGMISQEISPTKIAKIYEPFACAISVLADEHFFSGSYDYVKEVALAVNCPVLCKDIVVSPLQIYEARYYGADIVLLMLSVLDDDLYRECFDIAQSLNMDVICEVHSKEEMTRANKLLAPIIGINNRDLKTLKINMHTAKLALLAHEDALIILESGFSTHQQIMDHKKLCNGFLIGTSLMSSERIDLALREMIFGRVKICGLTNPIDAQASYEAGAYYGGLNFADISLRKISMSMAKEIIAAAPLIYGGVFVNQNISLVNDIARTLKLSFVQIHGDEDDDYIYDLRKILPHNIKIWRALAIKDKVIIPQNNNVDYWLLDSCSKNKGGSGNSFSWDLLKNISLENIILAGGIKPNNVKEASLLMPFALDCASGVEEDIGKKALVKLKQLFTNLRG